MRTREEQAIDYGVEAFWEHVDRRGPTECWLWKRPSLHHGYGQLTVDGYTIRAHRLAYTLLVGPIPPTMVLDHTCRVKACVNPAHLEVVTQKVNVRRGAVGQGCNRGEGAGTSKLTEKKVTQIRKRYAAGGVKQRDLAKEFGVSQMTVSLIVRGKQWAHVPGILFHTEPPETT